MPSIRVLLPQAMEEFVDARVAEGGYRDTGDYVLALIEQDRRPETRSPNPTNEELAARVKAGAEELGRGDFASFENAAQILDDVERRGRERLAGHNGKCARRAISLSRLALADLD